MIPADRGISSYKPIEIDLFCQVNYIIEKTQGSIPVIASGGIFTGEDAGEKLREGGRMVEVWTGFIYEGPFIVKRICEYLHRNSKHSV